MEYPCKETTMPNLSSTSATAASEHMSHDVPVQPRAAELCLDLARFVELLDPRCCLHLQSTNLHPQL